MIAQILEQTKRQLQLIKSDATSPRYPLWFITPESDKSLVRNDRAADDADPA
jgi:hypothetical protein